MAFSRSGKFSPKLAIQGSWDWRCSYRSSTYHAVLSRFWNGPSCENWRHYEGRLNECGLMLPFRRISGAHSAARNRMRPESWSRHPVIMTEHTSVNSAFGFAAAPSIKPRVLPGSVPPTPHAVLFATKHLTSLDYRLLPATRPKLSSARNA